MFLFIINVHILLQFLYCMYNQRQCNKWFMQASVDLMQTMGDLKTATITRNELHRECVIYSDIIAVKPGVL